MNCFVDLGRQTALMCTYQAVIDSVKQSYAYNQTASLWLVEDTLTSNLKQSSPLMLQESNVFFLFFYLVVNLGSLVGITVVVYVEENVSWACGFGLTGEFNCLDGELTSQSGVQYQVPTHNLLQFHINVLS